MRSEPGVEPVPGRAQAELDLNPVWRTLASIDGAILEPMRVNLVSVFHSHVQAVGLRRWLCGALLWMLSCQSQAVGASHTLVVAAYPAVDEVIRSVLPQWKRAHPNTEIRVLSRSFDDHHTVLATALSTASNLPDVMLIEVGYLGRFAAGGHLSDLSQAPFLIKEQQARFAPFAFRQATARSGAVIAVPADVGPGTLLYRADLLQTAGVAEAELTRSWDTYLAAGLKIKAATGASLLPHARNLAEVMIRSNTVAAQGPYFDASDRVLVESERFVKAFEMALKLRQLSLDARQTSWSSGWVASVRGGAVATLMTGSWMVGDLASSVAPDDRGRWRAAPLPQGSVNSWGGTFYTIPKGAKNKQLAWEFIQFMTLKRETQLRAFKSHSAFPALLEAYADPLFDQGIAYLGGQAARQLWRETVARIPDGSVHELDLDARIIVNNELTKVLDQGKGVALALHDARLALERLLRTAVLKR